MNAPKRKKVAAGCYHCGGAHRARACPTATCRICGAIGHDAGNKACPQKPLPPVDLGSFHHIAKVANDRQGFAYIELFAGAGGFRTALDKLGGQCVFASEIDRFCRKNYEINFGDRPAGDICRVPSNQIPDHDLLVGGFPCQPFSSSGRRLGLEDPRGGLFREICRILENKRPRAFLLENVRGLLLHDEGKTLELIVGELEKCGYDISYELVDAVTLLPQERSRLFFAGVRRDRADSEEGCNNLFAFPSLPHLHRGVEDVVQLQMGTEELERLMLSPHQLKKVQSQRYTQEHPEARFLSDRTRAAKTIQSSYTQYMVGSQFVSANKDEDEEDDKWRRFSSREVARLQGFPESFVLCQERAHHMLGNAVCPPVVALIAAHLLQCAGLGPGDNSGYDWGWSVAKTLLIEGSPDDERRLSLVDKLDKVKT
ncbi:hypothetical protein ACHAXT_006057 [Thalassiosira profunda]